MINFKMRIFILIAVLFCNIHFTFAQISPFYKVSGLNSTIFPSIFNDMACECIIYRSENYYNEHIDTISDFYPFCDSVKSVEIWNNFDFYYKYIPYMNNLQYALIRGYCHKKDYKQFLFSSNLEYLWVDYTALPLLVDYNQFKKSLKVLKIDLKKNFRWRTTSNYHFDFSEFDSLKYLSLEIQSKKSSFISITFPPNLYHLEWRVLPAHIYTKIPKTVEIMYLIIEDNVFPVDLYQLPKLKHLSIFNWSGNPILLPVRLPQITTLQTLGINNFSEQNVKIISQISQLDTLILINAQGVLPTNISLLNKIKFFKFNKYSEPKIVNQIKSLFPNSFVTVLQ